MGRQEYSIARRLRRFKAFMRTGICRKAWRNKLPHRIPGSPAAVVPVGKGHRV